MQSKHPSKHINEHSLYVSDQSLVYLYCTEKCFRWQETVDRSHRYTFCGCQDAVPVPSRRHDESVSQLADCCLVLFAEKVRANLRAVHPRMYVLFIPMVGPVLRCLVPAREEGIAQEMRRTFGESQQLCRSRGGGGGDAYGHQGWGRARSNAFRWTPVCRR